MDACWNAKAFGSWKHLAIAGVAIATGLGGSVPATAGVSALPPAYTSLPSPKAQAEPSAAQYAAELIDQSRRVPRARAPLFKRYRKFKVLSFQRALDLGNDEVIVKVQSPGKRKSIMMVELNF